jgi:hypothetical protein
MKHYWTIYTVDNERSSSYKYITDTLEDAQAHRMDFCGWYCEQGDCELRKIDQNFKVQEVIDYWHGEVWEHYICTEVGRQYLVRKGKKVK